LLTDRQWNEIPFESSSNHKIPKYFDSAPARAAGDARNLQIGPVPLPGASPVVKNNRSGGTTTYYRSANGNAIKIVKRGPRSAGLM